MNERKECTECESYDTEGVHTEWFIDGLEEVRISNNCPTEYVVKYSIWETETTMFEGERP